MCPGRTSSARTTSTAAAARGIAERGRRRRDCARHRRVPRRARGGSGRCGSEARSRERWTRSPCSTPRSTSRARAPHCGRAPDRLGVPDSLAAALDEPAFLGTDGQRLVTVCFWRTSSDPSWQCGPVEHGEKDGADWLVSGGTSHACVFGGFGQATNCSSKRKARFKMPAGCRSSTLAPPGWVASASCCGRSQPPVDGS